MFWVCAQEDEAVPRELVRDRFLQLTHHSVRGEIAIHWDDEAKPVATIPSSRRKHLYVAHRPAVYKDSPPPSLDSLFSLDFRSSEFQPGRHRRLAGSQDDPLLCALSSARMENKDGWL